MKKVKIAKAFGLYSLYEDVLSNGVYTGKTLLPYFQKSYYKMTLIDAVGNIYLKHAVDDEYTLVFEKLK